MQARRIAIAAQLLDRSRPAGLLELVRHLGVLQVDSTSVIAPNVDLVTWSRLGSAYPPTRLQVELMNRSLFEVRGMIRPREDIGLLRAEMAAWPGPEPHADWQKVIRKWVDANDACRRDILRRLDASGPLPTSDLPDTCAVPWKSSGWNNNRNINQMLDYMVQRGEIALVGRERRDRVWDRAERVYPDDPPVPFVEATRIRNERRLHALGIARSRGPGCGVEPFDVGDAGEPAVIEGVKGSWRLDPTWLDRPFKGRAAFLSPIDRLVYDRKRMTDLFDFDYQLEMYKPAAKRRWGYFALPILYGDRLVGKLDATADRKAGELRVDAIHRDVPFNKTMTAAVHRELTDLARWLDLPLTLPR